MQIPRHSRSPPTSATTTIRAAIDLEARPGGIDIVVNNAGIGAQGTVADNADDEWHRVFDVNVLGAVRVTRAALQHLRAPRPRRSSTRARSQRPSARRNELSQRYQGRAGSFRAMAADHLAEGIRVNCVNPGTADTLWVSRLLDTAANPEAERAALAARQPHDDSSPPDEVAAAVAYLVDPAASSTTGTSLAVDGGMEAPGVRT